MFLIIFFSILSILLVAILYRANKTEKFTGPTKTITVSATGDGTYAEIKKAGDVILSISGFVPDSWVQVSFNDFNMLFQVDSTGTMYWNDKKDALPVYLLSYNTIRIKSLQGYTSKIASATGPYWYSPFWCPPCIQTPCPPPNSVECPLSPVSVVYGYLSASQKQKSTDKVLFTFDLIQIPEEEGPLRNGGKRGHQNATITAGLLQPGTTIYT